MASAGIEFQLWRSPLLSIPSISPSLHLSIFPSIHLSIHVDARQRNHCHRLDAHPSRPNTQHNEEVYFPAGLYDAGSLEPRNPGSQPASASRMSISGVPRQSSDAANGASENSRTSSTPRPATKKNRAQMSHGSGKASRRAHLISCFFSSLTSRLLL